MEIIKLILENNPGVINILLTGLLLPVIILLITNENTKSAKKAEKEIEAKYKAKDQLRDHEKKVFSSLTKILFDVQQLHVSLSGSCVDTACIQNGLKRFDEEISKCHDDISENMLYLSSKAINEVYKFYGQIGQLKIELLEFDKRKMYELAHVAVYYSSQNLAKTVISIQGIFISQRSELKLQFDATQQEMMKYCCGEKPPKELEENYEALKRVLKHEHIQ